MNNREQIIEELVTFIEIATGCDIRGLEDPDSIKRQIGNILDGCEFDEAIANVVNEDGGALTGSNIMYNKCLDGKYRGTHF